MNEWLWEENLVHRQTDRESNVFKCTNRKLRCWCCQLVIQLREDLWVAQGRYGYLEKCHNFTFEYSTFQATVRHWSTSQYLLWSIVHNWIARYKKTDSTFDKSLVFWKMYLYNYLFVYISHMFLIKMRINLQYLTHDCIPLSSRPVSPSLF